MRNVLILGGASAIAQATARLFASEGASLFLTDIREDKLAMVADDLRVRGAAKVEYLAVDANDFDRHEETIRAADRALGGLDAALIAYGTLPDQRACEQSWELTQREFSTNGLSLLSYLRILGNYFEEKRAGCIAAISSVAGDRGRQSNYTYGAAKGAVSLYLGGLRHHLYKSGVKVVNIKPGFVDTPMTAAYKKGLLWAKPEAVARGIHRAMRRGKGVVYLPCFWRCIMLIIRNLPDFVFNRTRL
jgi:hypothetical protein